MNLKSEIRNNVVILEVQEERLDAHNSGDLKAAMLKFYEEGNKNILIDLKDVRFIDSSGLGALVSGFKNAISHQGNLKLASLQPQVKSMFELTRLHRVFEIFPSLTEAIESL
ncbi:STAS domain-containing protein [Geobacter argillaceus]|uniref:Anti-sigma factor antagonist n=1 Tax=Geobacter argillaceus TaxID=345631 RepID=A0A562VNI8_9BACT|nr:STAS domain-containing protein [Geobacter argillaceus]TWJ19448.1 anti-sigma B factor antagonist [Geobacter argillaceus]